jgi:drug/metabolite transporter (DMT)-like permease
MIPALITAFLFALSAVVSQRATRIFGPIQANAYRLAIATVVLGLVTLLIDRVRGSSSFHPSVFWTFFWSGAIGFGLGDIALFLAYPRLGARLTILLTWCGATLFGAWGDYALLGRGLSAAQAGGVAVVMIGVLLALWPSTVAPMLSRSGIVFGCLSGLAMGWGTVLSQHANAIASAQHLTVHGMSQAFQRITAGVLVGGLALLVARRTSHPAAPPKRGWRHRPFWLVATALVGPVLGVSCYQWAQLTVHESAVLVAVVSTSTLFVIPMARLTEREAPSGRQLVGSLMASIGVVMLAYGR